LGPLAPEAVAALVRRRLAHLDPGHDLAAAVAERSGGLALHVSALLDLLRRCTTSEEALRAVAEVPVAVRAVVEHQAAQLPAPALPDIPDDARPGLLAHRALGLHALGASGADADEALDDALAAALEAGDDELAVLVAIGDEPLGLSLQGDPRRLARLQRLTDRPLPPLRRLDLLAATIREVEATAHDSAPALVAQARTLADTVA